MGECLRRVVGDCLVSNKDAVLPTFHAAVWPHVELFWFSINLIDLCLGLQGLCSGLGIFSRVSPGIYQYHPTLIFPASDVGVCPNQVFRGCDSELDKIFLDWMLHFFWSGSANRGRGFSLGGCAVV